MEIKNKDSYKIQNEIQGICVAFELGDCLGLLSLQKKGDYIKTKFYTDQGEFTHYYRVND